MITDPQRVRKKDPGNPDICNVYDFHRLYSDNETVATISKGCRSAKTGCVECKKIMTQNLVRSLEPFREKTQYYLSKPDLVNDIIINGSKKAQKIAQETMHEVRAAMKI